MDERDAGAPWIHVAVLALAGVALRLVLRAAVGLDAGFGEDAEFWGYRAVELANGVWIGTHPAAYPGIVALLSFLPGSSATEAATWVSFVAGVAMAPAIAIATGPLAGRRAAALCGWFTFFFPGLFASSLRVEPTGLFVLCVAWILYAATRATRDGSVLWALAAGVGVAASTTVKENGLLYTVLLVPIVVVGFARGRFFQPLLPVAALAGLLALSVEFDLTAGAQASKASIPARDVAALLQEGTLPAPLLAKEDRWIAPSAETRAEIADPTTSIARRAVVYAGLQGLRLVRFLGGWLLLVPVATWAMWRRFRTGRIEAWQAAMLLALTTGLLPGLVIPIQPRHAEPGALGVVVAMSMLLVEARERGVRWMPAAALLVAAIQGAWLFAARELTPITYLGRCAAQQQEAAWQMEGWLREDSTLCSPLHWVGFRTGHPGRECDGEGEDPEVRSGDDVWFAGTPDVRTPFLHKILHSRASLVERARWEGTCFDTVTLEEVAWAP